MCAIDVYPMCTRCVPLMCVENDESTSIIINFTSLNLTHS